MESPFRPARSLLIQYASYHRDQRNIAIHCVGIPLIVFAICVLLSRPPLPLFGLTLTPIWIVWALTALWYLTRGNLVLGVVVSVVNAVLAVLAHWVAGDSTAQWLSWGIGAFIVGWVLQAIGHIYEGRKPAFVDDVIGLLVGPMFVTAEVLFVVGWGAGLRAEIDRAAGPVTWRQRSH